MPDFTDEVIETLKRFGASGASRVTVFRCVRQNKSGNTELFEIEITDRGSHASPRFSAAAVRMRDNKRSTGQDNEIAIAIGLIKWGEFDR